MTTTEVPRSLRVIAREIFAAWPTMPESARAYAVAMGSLDKITEDYFADSGRSIVTYFLCNASTWRGPDARRIKAELKVMLK
jgi:hypothetical protein